MPKTTKREITKREERIAKAHATPPPPIQDKPAEAATKGAGYQGAKTWISTLSVGYCIIYTGDRIKHFCALLFSCWTFCAGKTQTQQ